MDSRTAIDLPRQKRKYLRFTRELGDSSESRVKGILENIHGICEVQFTKRYSHRDRAGIDLVAFMDRTIAENGIREVNIQVVSSFSGADYFRRENCEAQRYKYPLNMINIDYWLYINRMIILNGQESPEYIRKCFWIEFENITNAKHLTEFIDRLEFNGEKTREYRVKTNN